MKFEEACELAEKAIKIAGPWYYDEFGYYCRPGVSDSTFWTVRTKEEKLSMDVRLRRRGYTLYNK